MKMLTCDQLGGPCNAEITGATEDELMGNGMKHLEAAHPEMAETVKNTPPEDPMMVSWMEKFKKDFAEAPEV